ncbi:MAG: sugar phosphate isomerase/epimerase family protein [Cellulosilyticaceae bacterium]
MVNTKIAAQMFTVREFTQTEKDFAETIKRLKGIGYDAVQISAIGPIAAEKVKEILDANEMTLCVTHTPMAKLLNQIDEVIADHKLWGCDSVGLGSMGKIPTSLEEVKAFCQTFNQVADKLHEAGLKFYYHNHQFEFEKFEGKNVFEVMAEETSADRFKFLVDTYWIQGGGASPSQFIKQYKDRIDIVHLKDMSIIGNKQMTTEVGLGNMDMASILETCEAIGVKWYAVEQDDCRRNPFESLEISLKNLKAMGLK